MRDDALDALIALYQQQPEGLGKQVRIEQAFRSAIGVVCPVGLRLPSHRTLCQRLHVARNTLAHAIGRLTAEGWLVTCPGQGTWTQQPPTTEPSGTSENRGLSARAKSVIRKGSASSVQSGAFMPGIPDITHFPIRKWRQLYTKVVVPHNALLLSYSSGGYGPLKRAIRDFLLRWRGIHCDSERIIITEGAHHAIELCAIALADVGDHALLDSPCYWGARNIFTAMGLNIDMVPWDPVDGYRLPPTLEQIQIAYFTGTRHYPLSTPTSIEDKRKLYAAANPAYIIEDDYEFSSDDVGNLMFDATRSNHLLVGSFSKLMFPGLRIGFLVAPQELVAQLSRIRSEVSREGRMLDQAVLAQFIAGGDLDAWYGRIRMEYLARQEVLHDRLVDLPGVHSVSAPSPAIGLCVQLSEDIDDRLLTRGLLSEQLVVRPLSVSCAADDNRKGLVVGIGMVSGKTLDNEANRLRKTLLRLLPEVRSSASEI